MQQERLADPFAAELRFHEQIFQVESRTSLPSRVVVEEERKACRLAVPLSKHHFEFRVGPEAIAQKIFFGRDRRLGIALVLRQVADELHNEGRVFRSCGSDGEHLEGYRATDSACSWA